VLVVALNKGRTTAAGGILEASAFTKLVNLRILRKFVIPVSPFASMR
jgi:hypothetical protein